MTTYLIYIIKWAIALSALYSLYGLVLRKETFHGFNRAVLLSILILSVLLPFCHIPVNNAMGEAMMKVEQTVEEESHALNTSTADTEVSPLQEEKTGGSQEESMEEKQRESNALHPAPSIWFVCLIGIYLIGLLYKWIRYIFGFASLFRTIGGGKRTKYDTIPNGIHLIVNNKVAMPCSWMKWVLISPTDLQHNGAMILRHEMAHIRKGHSWDMLLCDATANMLWFLPFAYLLRTDLRDVHEYQADKAVMESDVDEDCYQHMLITKASVVHSTPIVNNLNASAVKKRLTMMFRKESSRLARMKVLYIVPLLFIVLLGFARPEIMAETRQILAQEEAKVKEYVEEVITPSEEPQKDTEPQAADLPSEAIAPTVEVTDTVTEEKPAPQQAQTSETVTPEHSVPLDEHGLPILTDLPLNTNPNIIYGGTWLESNDDESILHFVYTFEKDDEWIFIADNGTYIINDDTKIRYKCRGAVTPHTLGNYFHVKGMKGKTVDLALIFPPLPIGADRVHAVSIGFPSKFESNYFDVKEHHDSRMTKEDAAAAKK